MATATADKTRENRLRAAAKRQGYLILKSRSRDPRAAGYGGWMIVNLRSNSVEAGEIDSPRAMSLDDVEKWLTDGPSARNGARA